MRMIMSGCLVAGLLSTGIGCQSWSQFGQAIPSGARVPPPGTGTYQTPSSYYNAPKTGAVGTTTQSMPASTTNGAPQVATAGWQAPTVDQMRSGINNMAGNALQDANNRANQVVQASTSRAAAAIENYTDPVLNVATAPSAPAPSTGSATRSLSDSNDGSRVNWQPPR